MKINNDISELLKKEFLITNGIGGYCSSSISFANTRKYHGILVSSDNPPTERNVIVHKVEERIKIENAYYDLSVNKYDDSIYPEGYQFLTNFERQPIPTWSYASDSWSVEKEVMMVKGSNTTIINYTNLGYSDIEIELHPLFTFRDYHSILKENHFDFYYEKEDNTIKVNPYPDSKRIYCSWSDGEFIEDRAWYKHFNYDKSVYRGLEAKEDSYRIGYVVAKIKAGKSISLVLTDDSDKIKALPKTVKSQLTKTYNTIKSETEKSTYLADLLLSGEQFIVNRASTKSSTILAGYHWFTDWGRDTMISMRGLTISTGRKKESESILDTFFKYLDKGMFPNRFPDYDGQEVEYNTIDATLWAFIAMYEFYQKFNNKKFIQKYLSDLEDILKYHIKGTRYNIKVDKSGFVNGGEEGWQLTWMDARVDGFVVTPRIGAPVEINLLWYNALKIFDFFCREFKYKTSLDIDFYIELIEKNFKPHFWNDDGFLNDYIDVDGKANVDFRCNQIYAVSLPFSLLTDKEEKQVVKQVEQKLLTAYGLRTLSPDHKEFVKVYGGGQWDRDTAYHQGTVWPFFIAEYFEAYLKVNKYSEKAKKNVLKKLKPLEEHFYNRDCVHGISEIFDGETPSDGRGCIQQAWSVAGIVKLYFDHELIKVK